MMRSTLVCVAQDSQKNSKKIKDVIRMGSSIKTKVFWMRQLLFFKFIRMLLIVKGEILINFCSGQDACFIVQVTYKSYALR